jgi:hypothetical protein
MVGGAGGGTCRSGNANRPCDAQRWRQGRQRSSVRSSPVRIWLARGSGSQSFHTQGPMAGRSGGSGALGYVTQFRRLPPPGAGGGAPRGRLGLLQAPRDALDRSRRGLQGRGGLQGPLKANAAGMKIGDRRPPALWRHQACR